MRYLLSMPWGLQPETPDTAIKERVPYALFVMTVLCILLLALPGSPHAASTEITIGMLSFRPVADTQKRWQPLANYLQQQLPSYRFRIHAYDYDDLEMAIRQRNVDLVFTEPAHYILLSEQNILSTPLVTVINQEFGRQLPAFGGVILVRADDSRIQQLDDLQDMTIASPAAGSFSGHMIQRYQLHLQGNGELRLHMRYTGMPHDRALEALLNGDADAAFIRSGVLESLLEKNRLKPDQIRVLNRINMPHYPYALSTRLYPEWPLVAMPHTDSDLFRQITAALLGLPHGSELGRSMGIYGFTIPMDYQQVRDLMQALHLPPFEKTPIFTIQDIWHRYRLLLLTLMIAIAAIGTLLVIMIVNSRKLQQQTQHAEQQTRQLYIAEQRLEEYFEVSPVVAYTLERIEDAVYTRWTSANVTRLLGYSTEETLADGWWINNIYPEDREHAMHQFSKLEKQQTLRQEYRFYKKDRSIIWILDQTRALHSLDGQIRIVGAWTDITERELARQAMLVEANNRRMLLASLGEGVYGTDSKGICTFINPAALEMLGFPEQEVLGQHQHLVFHHHREDGSHYPAIDCPVHKTLHDGESRHEEEWFIRKDGNGFAVDVTVTAVESKGERLGCVVVFHDISARKKEQQTLLELSQFRQAILDNNAAAIFVGSADRHIRMVNRRALELFGYSNHEIDGASFRLIHINDENFNRFSEHYKGFSSGQEISEAAWPFRHHNGDTVWCEAYGAPVNPENIEDGVIWTLIDVTAEREIAERNRLMVAALEAAANAIVITDTDAKIEWVNRAFEQLTGYRQEEAIGHTPSELIGSGVQDKAFYKSLWETIQAGSTWRGEVINRKKSGELYHEELIIAPVINNLNKIEHFVGVKQDISDRKRMEQELEIMATTDFLTNLPNRRHFIAKLEDEQARLRRLNGHDTCLLMLDIDYFKVVNDQYGHPTGDRVLQQLAELITQRLRRTDLAGRLGGEEFAILLPGADLENGHQFAEQLRKHASQLELFNEEGLPFTITISIGICRLNHHDTDPDAPLLRADQALYRAKHNGRNRVEIENA